MDRTRVVLAEILRPRGNRGEVAARSLTDIPGRLEQLKEATVSFADGSTQQIKIEECWTHKGLWIFKFNGVDSIDQAEPFSGADLWVAPLERAELEEGSYYQTDLVGCRLVNAADGNAIGIVEGWQNYGAGPLMEVNREGRELLVPFARALCREVNLESGYIVMDLPAGLLEL